MTDEDTIRRAGAELRRIREEKLLTLQQVQAMTGRYFGDDSTILYQQVSRIEKGSISKPPLGDLVRLGIVYGLTPNDIAAMYGLWKPAEETGEAPAVRNLRAALAELGPRASKKLEDWVDFAIMQARAEARREDDDE